MVKFKVTSRVSLPSRSAGRTVSRNATVLSMRSRRSAKVFSSSGKPGTARAVSRAMVPFAVSLARCTWPESGSISAASRALTSSSSERPVSPA
ncbi:hypothetical protein D9M72_627130 [compost metagenome]